MMYLSSKGPVAIATMAYPHARAALAKLQREAPERIEEITALNDHVAAMADQPAAGKGHNNPPADPVETTPASWEAIKLNMDDLLDQVRGVTGVEIKDQRGADQIGKLLRDLQDAAGAAEDARVAEKEPFDKAVKEIQDRYNAYIAPIKNKTPGLVSKAEVALKNQIAAWLRKLDDEKQAREAAAREAAEKAAAEASAAHQAARLSDDLDQIDAAEDLITAAEDAARELKRVEKEKTQVRTEGHRAIGLRSIWKAVRIEGEGGKALSHYAKMQPQRVIGFMQTLADEDVKAGVRAIPGFNIIEERVV